MQSDEDLILEYINGDEDSLKILIDRYITPIYNFSVRFVGLENADDITQDVFLKVWKNIRKFNHKKANFKTWIFTITRNTITDYLRKKKSINFSSLNTEEENFEETIEDEVILPDEAMAKLEDKEFFNKLLDGMPANYKEVLIFYYQEDMTFSEIGQLLGKPLNTVKSYHHRALVKLREIIDKKE
jgi:RNA polymerase sigma factor (sigma-70 family)